MGNALKGHTAFHFISTSKHERLQQESLSTVLANTALGLSNQLTARCRIALGSISIIGE